MAEKSTNNVLRSLREEKGLTQAGVARILKIAQQTYSNYETGDYDLPVRHLVVLAEYYHVTADYLLGMTKFRGTIKDLNLVIRPDVTFGQLISDILSLDPASKSSVAEYVSLLKLRQTMENRK